VSQATHTLQALAARLTPGERMLVGLFGALLLALGFYRGIVAPVWEARSRKERRVAALEQDLERIAILARRLRELEALVETRAQPAAANDFTLFAFMDRVAGKTIPREAVASMNPAKRPLPDGGVESVVELKLTAVRLPELLSLLRDIERGTNPAYVKRLTLKRRYEDRSRFDVVLIVGAPAAS